MTMTIESAEWVAVKMNAAGALCGVVSVKPTGLDTREIEAVGWDAMEIEVVIGVPRGTDPASEESIRAWMPADSDVRYDDVIWDVIARHAWRLWSEQVRGARALRDWLR